MSHSVSAACRSGSTVIPSTRRAKRSAMPSSVGPGSKVALGSLGDKTRASVRCCGRAPPSCSSVYRALRLPDSTFPWMRRGARRLPPRPWIVCTARSTSTTASQRSRRFFVLVYPRTRPCTPPWHLRSGSCHDDELATWSNGRATAIGTSSTCSDAKSGCLQEITAALHAFSGQSEQRIDGAPPLGRRWPSRRDTATNRTSTASFGRSPGSHRAPIDAWRSDPAT